MIVAAWIAGAVAATVYLPSLSTAQSQPLGGFVPSDSPALASEARSLEAFGFPLLSRVAVVQRNPNGLTDAELEGTVTRAVTIGQGEDPAFPDLKLALPVANLEDESPGQHADVSETGTTAITFLTLDPSLGLNSQRRRAQEYAATLPSAPGTAVGVTGTGPTRLAEWDAISGALPLVEAATVGLVALALIVTFRALGAAVLTLLAAGIAYLISVRAAAWAGVHLGVAMPADIEPILVVLLLGVVTDYAVFLLSGTKRRLAAGEPTTRAAAAATSKFAPIIATAGLIVCLGSAALVVGELEFFRAFGPGLAITVLVTLAVSLTFVPAALAIFGRAAFWPSLSRSSFADEDGDVAVSARSARLARLAASRRVAPLLVALGITGLLAGASGLRSLDLGFTMLEGIPASSEEARAAVDAQKGFAAGILSPTEALIEGPGVAAQRPALERFEQLLEERPGVAIVLGARIQPEGVDAPVFLSRDGSAARVIVVFDQSPLGATGIAMLRDLEGDLSRLLAEAGVVDVKASVTGDSALASDTIAGINSDLFRIAIAALFVNLVLLMLFLRSVVAPLYLVATSVLAVAAALGITSYVFEGLLGHDGLTYYVPFSVAVLLLSLGSDYNVFIVGRIWQEARRLPLPEAVAYATPRAARAITVAGVALAGSFGLLALIPLDAFREFAFAMAVGILIDTFLVRTLLVPSLITLFGESSWWPATRWRLREALDTDNVGF